MSKCIKCGSYAFNLYKDGIDQGRLCDVHYWQGRAHRAEALAEQPAQQEPVAYWIPKAEQFCIASPSGRPFAKAWEPLYTSPQASKPWVGLTDLEIDAAIHTAKKVDTGYVGWVRDQRREYGRAIEAKLKEKNA